MKDSIEIKMPGKIIFYWSPWGKLICCDSIWIIALRSIVYTLQSRVNQYMYQMPSWPNLYGVQISLEVVSHTVLFPWESPKHCVLRMLYNCRYPSCRLSVVLSCRSAVFFFLQSSGCACMKTLFRHRPPLTGQAVFIWRSNNYFHCR